MYATAVKSAAKTRESAEPVKLLRRIGSTTYQVSIHFSKSSQDKMEDILLRLIEREVSRIA